MRPGPVIRLAILGAGGFTGQELLRLLAKREDIEIVIITSNEYAGKKLTETFPKLESKRYANLKFSPHPKDISELAGVELVFLAVPDEVSLHWVPLLLNTNIKVIDISGAFRLTDAELFYRYYKLQHPHPELLRQAVYGLPEMNRKQIPKAVLLANPGCYPTTVILPLLALKPYLHLFSSHFIVDAKSGTSGAGGRKEKDTMAYSTVHENFRTYRVEHHQHTPEIEQSASLLSGHKMTVRFTPQLLPLFRGILANTYLLVKDKIDFSQLQQAAIAFAEQEPFVRYYLDPNAIELQKVQQTNFLDFSLHYDERNHILQIISASDNLGKGAAGQAIQNMNLMFGREEIEGLL